MRPIYLSSNTAMLADAALPPRPTQKNLAKSPLKPFLKWPGGKRWLVEHHRHLLPTRIHGRYIEPFLGSGALFFHLQPERSILSDANHDLISTYQVVRDSRRRLIRALQAHQDAYLADLDYYYRIRLQKPGAALARAARMLYLNRTCFNGIYRVNLKGEFNVPRGDRMAVLMADDKWEEWAAALSNAQLCATDFEPIIDQAEKGDFLFVDPPYTVHHNMNGFIKYNEVMFSWDDQVRLAKAVERARRRSVRILMTNANHDSVKALYRSRFTLDTVSRFSSVSGSAAGRNSFEELVITI